jgi:hypothetical protein
MPPGGIRTHDPNKRSAADLRLRPRSQWDRRTQFRLAQNLTCAKTFRKATIVLILDAPVIPD